MLMPPPSVRIFMAAQPTDLRQSFDTLAQTVRGVLRLDPFSGHLYVFFNRARNRVKILYWDRSGFWLTHKRLEAGTFRVNYTAQGAVELERVQLALILEGIDLVQTRRRRRYDRPPTPAPPEK
jgi:transposase